MIATRCIILDGMATTLGWMERDIDMLKVEIKGRELLSALASLCFFVYTMGVLLKMKRVQMYFYHGSRKD